MNKEETEHRKKRLADSKWFLHTLKGQTEVPDKQFPCSLPPPPQPMIFEESDILSASEFKRSTFSRVRAKIEWSLLGIMAVAIFLVGASVTQASYQEAVKMARRKAIEVVYGPLDVKRGVISVSSTRVSVPEKASVMFSENFAGNVLDSRSELVRAAIYCDADVAERMIASGADIDAKDIRGDTALSWAAKSHCYPVVSLLIKHGANVNSRSVNGYTPMKWAHLYGNIMGMDVIARSGGEM